MANSRTDNFAIRQVALLPIRSLRLCCRQRFTSVSGGFRRSSYFPLFILCLSHLPAFISVKMNAADEKEYGHWTVNQLRAELGRRGAKKWGRKQELVKR